VEKRQGKNVDSKVRQGTKKMVRFAITNIPGILTSATRENIPGTLKTLHLL
jgi:hypothetical protein